MLKFACDWINCKESTGDMLRAILINSLCYTARHISGIAALKPCTVCHWGLNCVGSERSSHLFPMPSSICHRNLHCVGSERSSHLFPSLLFRLLMYPFYSNARRCQLIISDLIQIILCLYKFYECCSFDYMYTDALARSTKRYILSILSPVDKTVDNSLGSTIARQGMS